MVIFTFTKTTQFLLGGVVDLSMEKIRRLVLFLFTASLSIFLLTTTAHPPTPSLYTTEKCEDFTCFLDFNTVNTSCRSIRHGAGIDYTVRLFLPFLMRLRTTFFPDFVFERERKPCVFARFLFFGWYVRLGMLSTSY